MAMWRCPHCGTPQAETARCWVCRRSSTACASCRHFRRSVAAQLGYCGLDRERRPLRGDEMRACWEPAGAPMEDASGTVRRPTLRPLDIAMDRTPVRKLEFVEVDPLPVKPRRRAAAGDRAVSDAAGDAGVAAVGELPTSINGGEPRWSLWGDAEI